MLSVTPWVLLDDVTLTEPQSSDCAVILQERGGASPPVSQSNTHDTGGLASAALAPLGATTTKLKTPTVTIAAASMMSIFVEWTRSDFANDYIIEYSTASNFATGKTQSITVPDSADGEKYQQFVLTELNPSVKYWVRVKATSAIESSNSGWSSSKSATTVHVKLDQPTCSACASSAASILIGITHKKKTANLADGFMIEFSTASNFPTGDATKSITVPGKDSLFTLTDLEPGTQYWVRVKSTSTIGPSDSDWSKATSVKTTTLPGQPVPSTLQNPSGYKKTVTGMKNKSKQTTQTSLVFTWTDTQNEWHTGKVSGKHRDTEAIMIDIYGPRPAGQKVDNVNNRVASLVMNFSGKMNWQRVQSAGDYSSYDESNSGAFVNKGRATSVWNGAANGGVQVTIRQVYSWKQKGNDEPWTWKNTDKIVYTIEITGLQAGTKYTLHSQAYGVSNYGKTEGFSKVTRFSAKTQVYAALSGIQNTVTSNSITLTWKASPFAETTHYEVRDAVSGTVLATVPATGTTGRVYWTYDELIPSTMYKFEIRAVSDLLDGLKSKVAKVSVKTTT